MPQLLFQRLALVLFLLYLALFPGSTIAVALDQVPAWGAWMGGALLLLQGAITLCWLIGGYGRRGVLAAVLIFLLGWGVEQLGVTTGFPFGRYRYTDALQPRLPGAVPLAIPCAWLMVALGADQVRLLLFNIRQGSSFLYTLRPSPPSLRRLPRSQARERGLGGEGDCKARYLHLKPCLKLSCNNPIKHRTSNIKNGMGVATLVVLLDMQIETVATGVNRYWVWRDGGLYYGVPAANFIAWWLVGLAMAALLVWVLRTETRDPRPETQERAPAGSTDNGHSGGQPRTRNKEQRTRNKKPRITDHGPRTTDHRPRTHYASRITHHIPTCLYLLSTLMFTAINLARSYAVAGLVGVGVLLAGAMALAPAAIRIQNAMAAARAARRRGG